MACQNAAKSSCELDVPVPASLSQSMFVKEKRLLGAGPSNPPSDVLKALSLPMMGHLHPETLKVRHYFQSRHIQNDFFLLNQNI